MVAQAGTTYLSSAIGYLYFDKVVSLGGQICRARRTRVQWAHFILPFFFEVGYGTEGSWDDKLLLQLLHFGYPFFFSSFFFRTLMSIRNG